MTAHHTFFMCRLDDALASVFVDVGLLEQAPDAGRPVLLGLRIAMRSPQPNGLSSDAEFDALRAIEEAWEAAIAGLAVRVAGRVTSDGHRFLYAYAPSADGYAATATGLAARFPTYGLSAVATPDPEWRQYLGVLCPGEAELHQIQNREMVDALQRGGDVLTVPRPVRHHAYFPGVLARDAYVQRAARLGFTLAADGHSSSDRAGLPFGVTLTRSHAVDFETLTSMTGLLRDLATGLRGEYDGCVTRVVAA